MTQSKGHRSPPIKNRSKSYNKTLVYNITATITDVKMTDVASVLNNFRSFRVGAWMFLRKKLSFTMVVI